MFALLKTFMAVYETRSFSVAADRLFVSQPTISHHIAELEKQLDVVLFIRQKRRPTMPTPAADALYEFSGKTLEEWNKTYAAIHNVELQETVSIKIGLSQSIATVLFPDISRMLHEEFPQLHYDVSVSNSATVVKQIEAQQIDLGFVEQSLTTPGIDQMKLSSDQLVLVGQPTGTWITRETGSGVGFYTYQYLHEKGLNPKEVTVVNTNQVLLQLVEEGVGQALVSSRLVPEGVPTEDIGEAYERHFYLLSDPTRRWTHQKAVTAAIASMARRLS